MATPRLNTARLNEFHENGYVIVPGFFSKEETDKLYAAALEDEVMRKHALDLNDQSGKKTRLSLWYDPGDDIYGQMIRSQRMVRSAEQLLDSQAPVCHYHTKLMQKEPRVGGAWEWHQDYGYWYKNQFMFPDQMVSVMVAFTPANQGNGCLQVIRGSHKMGRVNHGFAGEQVGADMVMVENALKTMELVYCELQPGDALFFHPNLLHRSEANLSDRPRWSIISVYVSQSNPAYNEETESRKTPVSIVSDEALLERTLAASTQRDFLRKEDDKALENTGWEE